MRIKPEEYVKGVLIVLFLVVIVSCGNSLTAPEPMVGSAPSPSDGTLSALAGRYVLRHVQCGPETSPGYTDSVLATSIHIEVVYSGNKAIRRSTVNGLKCTQTVPMDPIEYLPEGKVRITEQTSSCQTIADDGDCSPIASLCGLSGFTDTFTYRVDGSKLFVTILLASNPQQNPCAGIATDNAILEYELVGK